MNNSEYFQIDMAFKRVHGEISSKLIVILKIIIKVLLMHEFIQMDHLLKYIKSLWNYIKILTNESPTFYYIHNKGWKCILGDLDQGQAKGLGLALANIEPKYTRDEHLTYIFKSCQVHFYR